MGRTSLAALSVVAFLLLASLSAAQLGEVAGQPLVNVSVGGSNSVQIIVLNQANYSLPVRVVPPTLTSSTPNAITPTVTLSPMNGNIPPRGSLVINITVKVPGGDKPGYVWTGVMQVLTSPATTGQSGATIIEGVAKTITVTATKPIFNIYEYLIPAAIVIVIVAAVGAFLKLRKKPATKKAKAQASAKSKSAKGKKSRRAARKTTKRKSSGAKRKKATRARGRSQRRRR
jgi:hypothetical protein